jgi:hypothetical protein
MFQSKIFYFLILISTVFTSTEVTHLGTVISDFIEEFYVKNSIKFDVIFLFNRNIDNDVWREVQRRNNESYAVTVRTIKTIKEMRRQKINDSAVIFCVNVLNCERLSNFVTLTNQYWKPLKFLTINDDMFDIASDNIYNSDIKKEEKAKSTYNKMDFPANINIPKDLNYGDGNMRHFNYLLFRTTHSIHLVTFEWFTEFGCNKRSLVILNTFSKISGRWMKPLKNHQKFRDMNGCNITLAMTSDTSYEGELSLFIKNIAFSKKLLLFQQIFLSISQRSSQKRETSASSANTLVTENFTKPVQTQKCGAS